MNKLKKIVVVILSLVLVISIFTNDIHPIRATSSLKGIIGDQPKITGMEIDGFKHPSIGFSKESLELMQQKLKEGYDPWISALKQFANQANASLDYQTRNKNPAKPTEPLHTNMAGDAQAREGKVDGNAAWCQALMYVATGNLTYRKNAMEILRMWSKVRQTTNAFSDSHISSSEAVYPMVRAAELMRYTSSSDKDLEWKDEDTENFTAFLESLRPHNGFYHVNTRHMNQQSIANRLYLAIAIFENNQEYYQEAIEWTTANKTYVTSDGGVYGRNGAIYLQIRNVNVNAYSGEALIPHIQVSEMGRDQFHPIDGLNAITDSLSMMYYQGTKVDDDPKSLKFGEISKDGVGAYEFLDNRVVKGYNQISKYNMGYDINWTPIIADEKGGAVLPTYDENGVALKDENGNPTTAIYYHPSTNGRGGYQFNSTLMAYYTYVNKDLDWTSEDARYMKEAFERNGSAYSSEMILTQSVNAMTGKKVGQLETLPTNSYLQNKKDYDRNQFFDYYGRSDSVSTNTYTDIDGTRSVLYDVKGSGQYTWYKMNFDRDVDYITAHMASKGNNAPRGTLVDVIVLDNVTGIDENKVTSQDLDRGQKVATIVMPNTGSWSDYATVSQPLVIKDKDSQEVISDVTTIPAGEHLIAFRYYDNYGNSLKYQIAADWFTFSNHYANDKNYAITSDSYEGKVNINNNNIVMNDNSNLIYQDINYDNGISNAIFECATECDDASINIICNEKIVANYPLVNTNGELKTQTIALDKNKYDQKGITGRNDIKIEYCGSKPLILSYYQNEMVSYVADESKDNYEFEKFASTNEINGGKIIEATENKNGYLELSHYGKATCVSPSFPTTVKENTFISFRVKADGLAKLNLLYDADSATPYETLVVPDTNDQWINLTFDLYGKSYNGSVLYLQMESLSGENTKVQLDYKENDPQNKPPIINCDSLAAVDTIGVTMYDLKTTDLENDTLTYKLLNNVDGVKLTKDGMLEITTNDQELKSVYVAVNDGTSTVTKEIIISNLEGLEAIIKSFEEKVGDYQKYSYKTIKAYANAINDLKQLVNSVTKINLQETIINVNKAFDNLEIINKTLVDGTLDYGSLATFTSSSRNSNDTYNQIKNLFDNNPATCSDFRKSSTDSNGKGGWFIMDFKEGYGVKASSITLTARTGFGGGDKQDRLKHAYVQASNDNENWIDITSKCPGGSKEEVLKVKDPNAIYRYYRFISDGTWYGNLGEVRINGERVETITSKSNLKSLKIKSSNSEGHIANVGDKITITAVMNAEFNDVLASFNNQAMKINVDGKKITATYIVDENVLPGEAYFKLVIDGISYITTTNNSKIIVLSQQSASDYAKEITKITSVKLGYDKVFLPVVPGYQVTIEETSNSQILSKDGKFWASKEKQDVKIKLRITSLTNSDDWALTKEIIVKLPKTCDKSKLATRIKYAQNFTPQELIEIDVVLKKAKAVIADSNASELQVALVDLELIEALHNLNKYLPDHELLRQLTSSLKDVYETIDQYFQDGKEKDIFVQTYQDVLNYLKDPLTSSDDIQLGYMKLKDSIAKLIKLDPTVLQTTLFSYQVTYNNLNIFTKDSANKFKSVYEYCKSLLQHPGSQEALDSAYEDLKNSYKALIVKADQMLIEITINEANKYLNGSYTDESLKVLKEAISEAREVAVNNNASLQEGNAVVIKIKQAIDQLVKKREVISNDNQLSNKHIDIIDSVKTGDDINIAKMLFILGLSSLLIVRINKRYHRIL